MPTYNSKTDITKGTAICLNYSDHGGSGEVSAPVFGV